VVRFQNLAIIGGCGSSGTTLLAHLLNQHPEVISGPELNFFNHDAILDLGLLKSVYPKLIRNRRPIDGYHELSGFLRHRAYFGIETRHFENWLENSTDPISLINQLCEHVLSPAGKSMFVEKTPTNVYNFCGLSKLEPAIPLIHIVRDGRDVVSSLMRRGWSLFRAGSRWLYDTLSGLSARNSVGYLEIRYEDLVRKPAPALGKIFAHLYLPFDETIQKEVFSAHEGNWWYANKPAQVWGQNPQDPISTASIGKYKKNLTADMLMTLYRINLTERARLKLRSPVRSFHELVEFLNYEDFEDYLVESPPLNLKFRDKYYEILDYLRRFPKSLRKTGKLPQKLTRID
jgi:hypothetical protein